MQLQLKFGKAIDQDEKAATWMEAESNANPILVSKEIDWDMSEDFSQYATQAKEERGGGLARIADALAADSRNVYRAHIGLGYIRAEIREQIQRVDSPENKHDLTPDSWSLEIGPVMSADLGSEGSFFVGWISLNLSGYGYLYPWTFPYLGQACRGGARDA